MVGAVDDEEAFAARVRGCKSQRQLVGFAARIDEEAGVEGGRKRRAEALCVRREAVEQVTCVGVELRHLALSGFDDARMTVADVADVVDEIQVRASAVVVEVGAASPNDCKRLAIGERNAGAEVSAPTLEQRCGAACFCGVPGRQVLEQARCRRPRVHGLEEIEKPPGALFGHEPRGTARVDRPALGRDGDARRQPPADQREENLLLVRRERALLVVRADDECSAMKRVGNVEHGVGQRDGQLAHRRSLEAIAKIQQAADTSVLEQDVFVVRVAVNHRARQGCEARQGARRIDVKGVFDASPALRRVDAADVFSMSVCSGEVPGVRATGGTV